MNEMTKTELQEALLAAMREVAYYKQLIAELREQVKKFLKEDV